MFLKVFSLVLICSQLAYCNVYDLSSESGECPEGFFFSEVINNCKVCATCGPSMYIKKECGGDQDTLCDYCLSENPTYSEDFFNRCDDYRKLFKILNLEKYPTMLRKEQPRYHGINWALASLVAAISVALILTINKCVRRPAFREVTILPPELSEEEKRNIIFAAEHLRNKRTKNGYQRFDYV
ncbi:unnamed protein product [Bursaphelenchus okinawaensis]|uniref:TNFR-Cys domain-containing protein n=1 Tax=Bursaphelenchus okinawaensis TaxID=465554 RepID=A0A811KGU5_9BILA|nr:unnamed protein product [Bursaphelenchus okinawaensis]CAG9104221.1 unnamed protein product [Bursaphelenchus okinawaensis]